jgi:hypothetical protein
MIYPPKFYPNLADNNHCMQASIMMVLNTLYGDTSWDEVNKLTNYENNLYSWSVVAADVLNDKMPGTILISSGLDYGKFAEKGEEYLRSIWSSAWYNLQKEHASSKFQREQNAVKNLDKKGLSKYQKYITKGEIIDYLKDHYLIALIDPHIIKNTPGHSGHFVVIYDSVKENFYIHNPGLPPQPGWIVNHDLFMQGFKGDLIIIPKVLKKHV